MHTIRCAHCKRTHRTAREVSFCAFQHMRASANAANVRAEVAPTPRPNEWQIKTPRVMVEAMREGRYAVEVEGDWEFFRVSRPTQGKKKGCLVIQTQHSDYYKPYIIIYPSGSVWFAQTKKRLDMGLMMVAADPYTSAINYGRELGCCSRCARELTDERSRYYSIGPECEKHWPEILTFVNETRGPFQVY